MSRSIKSHVKFRAIAFKKQGGLCYYCQSPMWSDYNDIAAFSSNHNITLRQARHLQCTAEHLIARQDGGLDKQGNIVAACRFCNQRRHKFKRKHIPNSEAYKALIERRMREGRWRQYY